LTSSIRSSILVRHDWAKTQGRARCEDAVGRWSRCYLTISKIVERLRRSFAVSEVRESGYRYGNELW